MSDEKSETDLFGDPVIRRREGPGRPEHVWSRENSNKVLLAFARGLSEKDAATSIGISVPTLRKVYFSERAQRAAAKLRMEMTQLARLNSLADGGNVSAEKELLKQLDKMRQRDAHKVDAPAPTKAAKLGKKEARKIAAVEARGLYDTPPGPSGPN